MDKATAVCLYSVYIYIEGLLGFLYRYLLQGISTCYLGTWAPRELISRRPSILHTCASGPGTDLLLQYTVALRVQVPGKRGLIFLNYM